MDLHIRDDEKEEEEERRSRHASGNSTKSRHASAESRSRHAFDNNARTRHVSQENGSLYALESKSRNASGNGSIRTGQRNGFQAVKNDDVVAYPPADVEMISFVVGREMSTYDILNEEESLSFIHPPYDAAQLQGDQGDGADMSRGPEAQGQSANGGDSQSLQYRNGVATGDINIVPTKHPGTILLFLRIIEFTSVNFAMVS